MSSASALSQSPLPRTILVAEDDRELQDLYELVLRDEFDLIQAYNGREALELYLAQRPDLVIMDIKMPLMTGDEAIQHILATDPHARILAVTAYHFEPNELGVPVLRKGFSIAELLEHIRRNLPD